MCCEHAQSPANALTDACEETQAVKISPYLEMPLRSLDQVEADRQRRAVAASKRMAVRSAARASEGEVDSRPEPPPTRPKSA